MSGLIYLASALILGFIFLAYAIRIYKNPGDNQIAWRTFQHRHIDLSILLYPKNCQCPKMWWRPNKYNQKQQ
jgi:heme O synthase-like polyprenyltransferase